MRQKTVRFYEKNQADVNALEKLNNYKEYGFSSSRAMIITAINAYSTSNSFFKYDGELIEKLAERIAEKIGVKFQDTKLKDEKGKEKGNENDTSNNEDMFEKALSFMETL